IIASLVRLGAEDPHYTHAVTNTLTYSDRRLWVPRVELELLRLMESRLPRSQRVISRAKVVGKGLLRASELAALLSGSVNGITALSAVMMFSKSHNVIPELIYIQWLMHSGGLEALKVADTLEHLSKNHPISKVRQAAADAYSTIQRY